MVSAVYSDQFINGATQSNFDNLLLPQCRQTVVKPIFLDNLKLHFLGLNKALAGSW